MVDDMFPCQSHLDQSINYNKIVERPIEIGHDSQLLAYTSFDLFSPVSSHSTLTLSVVVLLSDTVTSMFKHKHL